MRYSFRVTVIIIYPFWVFVKTKNAQNELMQIVHHAHFEYFLRFVVDPLLVLCIIIYI